MATLKRASEYFTEAQAIALREGIDFNELIAIGLQEMAKALDADLSKLQSDLDDVETSLRRLS